MFPSYVTDRAVFALFTLQLHSGMADAKFFAQRLIDLLHNLSTITDHLIFDQEMATHGIHAGGYRPQMYIVNIRHTFYFPDRIIYLAHIKVFGNRFQKNIDRLPNQPSRSPQNQ
jgi:Gpi18-like mannosyltransferase